MSDMVGATLSLILALVVLYLALSFDRRRSHRQLRDTARWNEAFARGRQQPPSLHPVIDPDRCIGSMSCISACPEGDIIGLIDGKAALVEASACIGHARCAVECPTSAIQLVMGSRERTVLLPDTDDSFETSRPGVYAVGEVAGMGLIARAIQQGLALAPMMREALKGLPTPATVDVDVAVVGGGPAGIACAVRCLELGLVPKVLEQDTLGGCIAHYPRGKVVMSETVSMPFVGSFGRAVLTKEELLAEFENVLDASGLTIEGGQKVVGIEGAKGAFTINLEEGAPVRARLVVLAIGLRGSPRKLDVPGEELEKVSYRLIEPEQFDGKRVLVVGGGDSAVEAATQLALESSAKVTLSYRGPELSRCKPILAERMETLIRQGRVRALFGSEVKEVRARKVKLVTPDGPGRLRNDHIIVAIGGMVPTAFLDACGVRLAEFQGKPQGHASQRAGAKRAQRLSWSERLLALGLVALSAVALYGVVALGADYYLTPVAARHDLAVHADLKPSGPWGHRLGVIATLLMVVAFSYVVRKRGRFAKGRDSIRGWMIVHVWAGVLGPALVVFHAAVVAQNLMALWSAVGFGLVVGTGVFGLLVFTRIPADPRLGEAGVAFGSGRAEPKLDQLKSALERHLKGPPDDVLESVRAHCVPDVSSGLLATLWRRRAERRRLENTLAEASGHFLSQTDAANASAAARRVLEYRLKVKLVAEVKRQLQPWLVLHVASALVITLVVVGHIALSLYLGFSRGLAP